MAIDVSQYTAPIKTAAKARDVRDNIANGIDAIATEVNQYEADLSADNDQFKEDITAEEKAHSDAETARVTAEQARQTAETTRQQNETARQTAENNRITAEAARETAFSQMQHIDANAELAAARQGKDSLLANLQDKDSQIANVNSQLADIVTLNVKNLPSPLVSLKGDGITDDTQALQAAINYLASNGGGKLFFPKGIYLLNGSLQDADNYNSIIKLPLVDAINDNPITIELIGVNIPATAYPEPEGNGTPPTHSGAILYSTVQGSGGLPSIIAGHKTLWSDITFVAKNLVIRQINNSTLNALELQHIANVIIQNVVFDLDVKTTQIVRGNGIALDLPTLQNYALVRVRNVYILGYTVAIQHSEHADLDNVFAQYCSIGLQITAGYHAIHYGKLLFQSTDTAINAIGKAYIYGGVIDIENGTTIINDPNNYLWGSIFIHHVTGNVGVTNQNLAIVEANNLIVRTSDENLWFIPTLKNNATVYSGFDIAYARIEKTIHLRGLVTNITNSTIIFTLPNGFHTSFTHYLPAICANADGSTSVCTVKIYDNGDVEVVKPTAAGVTWTPSWVSIECSFL
ncbi:glycosyl hydrolase family 28-related protein [Clostridium neuense]|uniref:Glycosyl hydrolase family 28-related protein n=1 Tax=Clostridium neuense TaxID=1728934 RepID=A0ABW8THB6_9CLOT